MAELRPSIGRRIGLGILLASIALAPTAPVAADTDDDGRTLSRTTLVSGPDAAATPGGVEWSRVLGRGPESAATPNGVEWSRILGRSPRGVEWSRKL